MIKPKDCTQEFVEVSDSRSCYREVIKQDWHSNDCGNPTSLIASTLGNENDPKQSVIEINDESSNAKGETAEVSSQNTATNRSRNELSVVKSCS